MTDDKTPATLPKSLVETLPSSGGIAAEINDLTFSLGRLRKELDKQRKRGAIASARSFVVLHRLKDKFEALDKAFSALYQEFKSQVLPEIFESEGITSLPLAEGYRVGIRHDTRASIRKGMKDAAYAWLRENGLDDLVTETVNSSTLSAAAEFELEEHCREFPEDLFNVVLVPTTSVTVTRK